MTTGRSVYPSALPSSSAAEHLEAVEHAAEDDVAALELLDARHRDRELRVVVVRPPRVRHQQLAPPLVLEREALGTALP